MQHHAYEQELLKLGYSLVQAPAVPELPDSIFVEDTVIVVDEMAILTLPGAASRRPEVEGMASALLTYRRLHYIQAPGILDGGDVLRIGKKIWIGLSNRSNKPAVEQVQQWLSPFGYEVEGLQINGCLHLKSAVTQVGPNTLLINSNWANPAFFPGFEMIEVDPEEPGAANALYLDNKIIYPLNYPKTLQRLQSAGIDTIPVNQSEVIKAEGGVTCCCVLLN
jgi:dimethylargininase